MCVGCLCAESVECRPALKTVRACKNADMAHLHIPKCGHLHADARTDTCVCAYMRRAAGMEWLSSARSGLGALEVLDLSHTQMGVGAGPLLLAQGLKRLLGLRRLRLAENRLMDQVLASDAHAPTLCGHARAALTSVCTRAHSFKRTLARTHMPFTPTHSPAHMGSWRWRILWSTGPVCCTNLTCGTTPSDPLVLPPSPRLHMARQPCTNTALSPCLCVLCRSILTYRCAHVSSSSPSVFCILPNLPRQEQYA